MQVLSLEMRTKMMRLPLWRVWQMPFLTMQVVSDTDTCFCAVMLSGALLSHARGSSDIAPFAPASGCSETLSTVAFAADYAKDDLPET